MIVILNFKKEMQVQVQKFIIENMKKELIVSNKRVFNEMIEDLKNIYENYINNEGEMLYAYDIYHKRIVGTIAMKYENNIAVLKRFYVDEKYRNRKMGLLLYKELEEKIQNKRIKEMYLTSGAELTNAHKFYEKNGWSIEYINPGIKVRQGAILYKKNFVKIHSI